MDGLVAQNPSAIGNIDLRIYTNATQYSKLSSPNGLAGYFLDKNNFLIYEDVVRGLGWIQETINGLPIQVLVAP